MIISWVFLFPASASLRMLATPPSPLYCGNKTIYMYKLGQKQNQKGNKLWEKPKRNLPSRSYRRKGKSHEEKDKRRTK